MEQWTDTWGFAPQADITVPEIISFRVRPDGIDKIHWNLWFERDGCEYYAYYKQTAVIDATEDMIRAEQEIDAARWSYLREVIGMEFEDE